MKRKTMRNFLLVAVILGVFWLVNLWGLSPEQALHRWEKTKNYGPSQVTYQMDVENGCYLLCQHEDHFSGIFVRRYGPFWQVAPEKGQEEQQMSARGEEPFLVRQVKGSKEYYLWGWCDPEKVGQIELLWQELANGTSGSVEHETNIPLQSDGSFIYDLRYLQQQELYQVRGYRVYDKDGKVLYNSLADDPALSSQYDLEKIYI